MPDAEGLTALGARVHATLGARHAAREAALPSSRASIRASANAIRAAHRGEHASATALAEEAAGHLAAAIAACEGVPMVRWAGFVHDAEKEYAEARTTLAVLTAATMPTAEDLGVDVTAWLNGVAETVGEIRRYLLDQLRHGRLERCESLLETMDEIYALLVTIDFPDGITGGLRRSTDVARSILERTRGDFTTAQLQERLRAALESHSQDLRDA